MSVGRPTTTACVIFAKKNVAQDPDAAKISDEIEGIKVLHLFNSNSHLPTNVMDSKDVIEPRVQTDKPQTSTQEAAKPLFHDVRVSFSLRNLTNFLHINSLLNFFFYFLFIF